MLKAIISTAVADDLITAKPCRTRGASSAPRVRDIRPVSIEELAVIVDAVPEQFRAIVRLGAWCALRGG